MGFLMPSSALVFRPHGADSVQEALGSLRVFGVDRQGIGLLGTRERFESRELSVQDCEIRLRGIIGVRAATGHTAL